jgi:hypothetical protein
MGLFDNFGKNIGKNIRDRRKAAGKPVIFDGNVVKNIGKNIRDNRKAAGKPVIFDGNFVKNIGKDFGKNIRDNRKAAGKPVLIGAKYQHDMCEYGTASPYTTEDLAEMPVGQSRVVAGTCSHRRKPNDKWCPDNGEFMAEDSDVCKFNNKNFNGLTFKCNTKALIKCGGVSTVYKGNCEANGTSTQCKRRLFLASPEECCKTSGTKIINGKTCDPKYYDSAGMSCRGAVRDHCKSLTTNPDNDPSCKTYMSDSIQNELDIRNAFCSRDENIFDEDMCRSWVTNPEKNSHPIVDVLMKKRCTKDKLSKDPCKSYIRDKSKISSSYDNIMTEFCKQNPESTLCRCIMSEHNEKTDGSLKGRPECIDEDCAGEKGAESPFMTHTMNENSGKCSYVNCQQWVEFGPTIGTENENIANMEMNCGVTNYSDGSSEETEDTSGGNTTGGNTSSGNVKKTKTVNGKIVYDENSTSNTDYTDNTDMNYAIIQIIFFFVFVIFGSMTFMYLLYRSNQYADDINIPGDTSTFVPDDPSTFVPDVSGD